ncbi:IS1595 family transposase [Bacteroides heparinolyticus]|uniref:IS1595 family transposase n=1 Tax=Prevotella heparinolytica TaxID=28113 RepID=UPI0035A0C731
MKLVEFSKRFPDEESCEKYLYERRVAQGVVCSKCGNTHQYWDKSGKCWRCAKCGHVTTLTSGTVMHGSKLPLLYWFTAIHLMTATKKTFSALEMQRQLGHKRYQPIWEMMHKLRSVMGIRDDRYKLQDTVELDEGFFTCDDERKDAAASDAKKADSKSKGNKTSGLGSEIKAKVEVMVESVETEQQKKGQKTRKAGHIKMKVMKDLTSATINDIAGKSIDPSAGIIGDAYPSHSKLANVVANVETEVVRPQDAPKVLPWVHTAIANAKSLFRDMYHGIKEEYLQEYLNEFCYKFNRRYFGERIFDRLVIAAISYRPSFEHRLYGTKVTCKCG